MRLRYPLLMAVMACLSLSVSASRERRSLDTNWKFILEDQSMAQGVDFDDASWRTLDVPHDWAIEQPFSKENSSRNAYLPGGIAWYRKSFELAEKDGGKRVELQFDGVYKHAQVWVNGSFVGTQYDGYTSFYFDITDKLIVGEANVIAVRVDNSLQPNCRWYTGSGIYRHVWLNLTDPLHVENWGTFISTPTVTKSEALIRAVTTVTNEMSRPATFSLQTDVLNSQGDVVASVESSKQNVGAGLSFDVEQQLHVFKPLLWSVETPEMYTAVSRISFGGRVVDIYRSRFGIREIRFDAKKGFFLNGENMKMKGVCLHAEAATFGSAVPKAVWARRLKGLKEVGVNAIRTAHNAMAPEFMDLCDELGFLVMDEFADKWDHEEFADPYFHSEWRKNYKETIRRDRNHPSVVIWSVGNENHAPGSEAQTRSLEMYCNYVRSIDPTRPVVSGMERGLDMDPDLKVDSILESTQHMDLIGMNYGEQWVERIANRNSGKAFVGTESNTYYGSTETERWSLTERSPWFDVIENDSNIGLFFWVGIEYMGEIPAKGKDSWPETFCWPSAFLTSDGLRTPLSYYFQSLWTEEPVVSIAVYDNANYFNKRWGSPLMQSTWNHEEGSQVDVVTYSNCEFVELYVNERKIGIQKMSDFSFSLMNWREIAFEAGTIRAVGIRGGKPVCEFEIATAGAPIGVELAVDVDSPKVGDIVHVEVNLVDERGIGVNRENRRLSFEVEGGEIVGLDNGGLNAFSDMQAKEHRITHQGSCVAIVRVGDSTRSLRVTVAGGDLQQATLELPVSK